MSVYRANAEFIQARMIGLDLDKKLVLLDNEKQPVYYDYLSINIGSVTKVYILNIALIEISYLYISSWIDEIDEYFF
jgi:hypothetical protein